jgi:SEC-C motif-containing protein
MKNPCPCASAHEYKTCCGQYHSGKQTAPTAEALMRSRYSAYVLQLTRYLFKTWHPSTRPTYQSLLQQDDIQWLSLKITQIEQGIREDHNGMVTFVATYVEKGQVKQFTEVSEFIKIKKQWVYIGVKN